MFKRVIIIFCLLSLLSFSGMGQRVIDTIDPNRELELDEPLKFDSNWIPVSEKTIDQNNSAARSYGYTVDLNFCPNVVFTEDSSRGFVSYTGSDKVMVFNPKTSEIIDLLDVPENPGHIVISPDGTKIAFPSHQFAKLIPDATNINPLAGAISVVDTETLEVVSVEYDNLAFSAYNNVVFSEDSSVIYICSMKTDEMLMLDSETLSELSPRLKFTPGTRPASMERIPGTNQLSVVLVGSNSLSRDTYPDSIAFVDLESFSITGSVYPVVDPDSTDISHYVNFTATTTIAFSPDGKWAAIADQELSSKAAVPELSNDRVWILDVENREFVDYVYSPGMSGATYWVPSTEEFVTVGAMSLLFVEPEEFENRVLTPSRGDFRARSSLSLLDDDRTLMIPSPTFDSLMMIDYYDDITMRGVVTGGRFIRDPSDELDCDLCVECVDECEGACKEAYEESDQEDSDIEEYTECQTECAEECESSCDGCEYVMEGPMQVAYTPDREVFVVVSFNRNVIHTVKETYHFPIPKLYINNDEFFTGVAFLNTGTEDAELWGAAYTSNGLVLVDDPETEGVDYANPIKVALPAGKQKTFVGEELIQPLTKDYFTSWIDMDSDVESVSAMMFYGDDNLRSLDGVNTHTDVYKRFVFPDVRVDGNEVNGELNIFNPNLKAGDLEINLYNEFGGRVANYGYSVPTRSFYSVKFQDEDLSDGTDSGLFNETVWDDFNYGYIEVVSTSGALQGFQRGIENNKMSLLPAWSEGSIESASTEFYVPMVVTLQGAESWINIVNTNYADGEDDDGDGDDDDSDDENMWVTIRFWTDYGAVLSKSLVLIERNSFRIEIADLFDLYETGQYVTGWLEIVTDRTGLAGNVELRLTDQNMTQMPLQVLNRKEFLFGHVAEGFGIETGLALVNPGEVDVDVEMEVYNSEGEITGEAQFVIPAEAHISQLLSELVPELGTQLGGYIKLSSSDDIVGIELFYRQDLEYVASVVPK